MDFEDKNRVNHIVHKKIDNRKTPKVQRKNTATPLFIQLKEISRYVICANYKANKLLSHMLEPCGKNKKTMPKIRIQYQ